MASHATVARKSGREMIVTRTFDAPAHRVFDAWTQPALLQRWWVPKSMGSMQFSCTVDARKGGSYRFEFRQTAADQPIAFFGRYTEVTPYSRLVWTNEEGAEGPITTLTLEETGGVTRLVLRDIYPSAEALDAATVGMENGPQEQFAQLDALLAELADKR